MHVQTNSICCARWIAWVASWIACAFVLSSAHAEQQDALAQRAVMLLKTRCVSCHGAEKAESGLRLDSAEHFAKGGDRGKLVEESSSQSLLIRSIRGDDEELQMPPKQPLTPDEVKLLEDWVKIGSPWPSDSHGSSLEVQDNDSVGNAWVDPNNPIRKLFGEERLGLWSLRPISRPAVPSVKHDGWALNALDHFVLSAWEENSTDLPLAPDASERSLAIRLAFDLTGLPPELDDIGNLTSKEQGAYDRYVDRLLSSPDYGVRWARMWLDVVRYSDSNGFDWDEFRPQAWRFRDYVVDAWNSDLPFDQFTLEQLAGDELVDGPPADEAEQQRWVATGYLRAGPQDNSSALFDEQDRSRAQLLADLTETTGSAFLGLTLSCCRCHDHKTDPLSHADHYRLRAFFAPVEYADDVPLDLPSRRAEIEKHNAAIDEEIAQVEMEMASILASAKERLKSSEKNSDENASEGSESKDPSDDAVKKSFTEEEAKRTLRSSRRKAS